MMSLAVVAVGAVVHVAVAWTVARPPAGPIPDRAGYLSRWSRLHGGYDPTTNPFVRGWLSIAFVLARPLAKRGVHPNALTALTVWLAVLALVSAETGGHWPLLGAAAVVASGVGDAVDGAVATLTDRATRWGYVLDSLVDRVCDVLYVAALWRLGAPLELAAVTAVGLFALEYVRARASNAGAGDVGTITVGERASRVICAGIALTGAGVLPEEAVWIAAVALWVLAGLTAVGLVQLLVAVRRLLASA